MLRIEQELGEQAIYAGLGGMTEVHHSPVTLRRRSVEAQVTYEEQIVQTVRRLPIHRRLEALKMLQRLEGAEEAKAKEAEVEPKLPRFMQNMIEAGTLELSEYQHTGLDEQHRYPEPSLEELRRRLKGISVPIEEYIRAERSKH